MNKAIRINKYLAGMGVAARRKIDALIESGKVIVNGKKAVLGMKVDPARDVITVNGAKVKPVDKEYEYIALYKPRGVVSTALDTHGRQTVVELVNSSKRLYPVGRLDVESEGLMLLTNDGEMTNHLMHPRFHVSKTYIVKFLGKVGDTKINALRSGVRLPDGVTAPADVEVLRILPGKTELVITLFEGKNRQIRRMAEKLRLHVLGLKRIKIGRLEVGDLGVGKWRKLTESEVISLKEDCGQVRL